MDRLMTRMQSEQDSWRGWLLSLPKPDILHHTYEHTVREDILMALEEMELSEEQVAALLCSPCPLRDIYEQFRDTETDYMDAVRDAIRDRAMRCPQQRR